MAVDTNALLQEILAIIGIASGVAETATVGTPQAILKAAEALSQIASKALLAHQQVLGTLIDEGTIKPIEPIQ